MPPYYVPSSLCQVPSAAPYNGVSGANYMTMSQQINPNIVDSELVMKWVEGEVCAKAFNMPPGWPANRPIPLWDSTDTVIWLKSWGPMGIPNPMQKIRYKMPEQQSYYVPTMPQSSEASLVSEDAIDHASDKYATKEDLAAVRDEIRSILQTNQNMHLSQPAQNNQNGSRGDKK